MKYKTIKVKLYPTVKQKCVLDNHFNGYRFAYNLCLEYKNMMWKQYKINKSGYDMCKELAQIRNETPWLKRCKAECIVHAALGVEKVFKKFYNGNGYPKFKKRNEFFYFHSYHELRVIDNKLKFFKNKIKYKTSDKYKTLLNTEKIKKIIFNKDKAGDYFATFIFEYNPEMIIPTSKTAVGIDLGIKMLITTSDGVQYKNNKHLINTKYKITKLQRQLSKSKKGGSNRNKIKIQIAKTHRKVFRQKEHEYNKVTNEIIRNNQTIVMETLKIKNMIKNHKLARSINDASWGYLTNMLEYKSIWHGRDLIKINTYYPSSKTCSNCGNIKENILLSERIYDCESCGLSIDRDINAAINIRNQGLRVPGLSAEDTVNRQASEAESNQ